MEECQPNGLAFFLVYDNQFAMMKGSLPRHSTTRQPDVVARIYQPARSVMQAGRANVKRWTLEFEPQSAPFIEPLMGWTGSRDTLQQVRLTFPTQEQAVAFAERQGWAYSVSEPHQHRIRPKSYADNFRTRPSAASRRQPQEVTLTPTSAAWTRPLQGAPGDGQALPDQETTVLHISTSGSDRQGGPDHAACSSATAVDRLALPSSSGM